MSPCFSSVRVKPRDSYRCLAGLSIFRVFLQTSPLPISVGIRAVATEARLCFTLTLEVICGD